MAEVELNLHELSVPEMLAIANGIAAALQDNANFPAPNPSPQELHQVTGDLAIAEDDYREKRAVAAEAKFHRDTLADQLKAILEREAEYVQTTSGGSIAKILSASMHVEEETSFWPFNRIGQLQELSASAGDEAGEIDLDWEPLPGASGYEAEIAYDLVGEGPWEQCGATMKSKLTIGKLTGRGRLWFRVRAVGEHGVGEWSDKVMRYAP
jgi:hypothetical protein